MNTIIIYGGDGSNLYRTICEIYDKTPSTLVDEIIVVSDNYQSDDFRTIECVGNKAKSLNNAIKEVKSKYLVFLHESTKLSVGWLDKLSENPEREVIKHPIHAFLDESLWACEDGLIRNFSFRWDLNLIDRKSRSNSVLSAATNSAIFISKSWFEFLGGFDEGMHTTGDEHIFELTVRSWMFGGSLERANCVIACNPEICESNLARIVEVWFPAYANYFYELNGLDSTNIDIGNISNLLDIQDKQVIVVEQYLELVLPELLKLYDLRFATAGKSIAIVCDGPSLNLIDSNIIYRNNIVISVDYIAKLYRSDYVVTLDSNVITQLRDKYDDKQFVIPSVMKSKLLGYSVEASSICPDAIQFEQNYYTGDVRSVYPPFINYDNAVHTALHFALFLGPSKITLYGCDNKFINGNSHSTQLDEYEHGKLWADTEASRSRFASFEFGLDMLGKIALNAEIPVFRMNHV